MVRTSSNLKQPFLLKLTTKCPFFLVFAKAVFYVSVLEYGGPVSDNKSAGKKEVRTQGRCIPGLSMRGKKILIKGTPVVEPGNS